ncbi:MAG: Hpt domain-containing protein [Hymenobacter sp.]
MYNEFVEETTDLLAQANAHWEVRNLEGLHPLLHQLKGTAGTLGLTQLAGKALAMEQAIKQQETETLTEGLAELGQLFAQFVSQYPALLAATQPDM